jgi:hypothetical protein
MTNRSDFLYPRSRTALSILKIWCLTPICKSLLNGLA